MLEALGSGIPTPAVIDLAIATLAVLLIASPLLFTSDGFSPDFTNAIWLAGYQQHVIAAHLHPTLFLQTQQGGVFYPMFAFYGGTLFALTGALAALLGGSTILAFEAVTLAAIAAAYGGLFWLARQLGVKGVLAHAPAIVFVTSAYYVSNLYGRGAWAEFIAVSALPLVLAASLRLVRGRLSVGPVACLVAASVGVQRQPQHHAAVGLDAGSCGARCLLAGKRAFARAAVAADARRRWTDRARRRPERLVFAPRPQLRTRHGHRRRTRHVEPGGDLQHLRGDLRPAANGANRILDFRHSTFRLRCWRSSGACSRRRSSWRYPRLRAGVATALIVLACLLVLIMSSAAWSSLPTLFQRAQFTYRLQTYVTLACAGLVLVGALALTRRAQSGRATRSDRALALGLGLVVAFGVAICAWQLWVPNTHVHESASRPLPTEPRSCAPRRRSYPNRGTREPTMAIAVFRSSRRRPCSRSTRRKWRTIGSPARSSFPAGLQPFATNIAGGPYLVHVGGGVRVVGRTEGGYLVLQRTTDGSQPVPVELRAQLSAPVVLGRITTAVSAALLLGVGCNRRRAAPATALGSSPNRTGHRRAAPTAELGVA